MGKYNLVGNKNDEVPVYLVDDTTYELDDADLLADMAAESVGAPVGTIITKSGMSSLKQLGLDNTFTEFDSSGGGGGGEPAESAVFVATISYDGEGNLVADVPISDAFAAVAADKTLVIRIDDDGDYSWHLPSYCVLPDDLGSGYITVYSFNLSGPLDDSPYLVCDVYEWALDDETETITYTAANPVPSS